MDDYKELNDREILKLVDDNIHRSVGYYDSDISRERELVTSYYNASSPKPTHDGNSKYVSQDVYNSVESLKASLLETFSAGNNIVRFAPQSPQDVPLAEIATKYTDYVLYRQNDAYNVFSSVIHDGLTSRVGLAKVYWQSSTDIVEREFEQVTPDELDVVLMEDGIELGESTENDLGLISGTLFVEKDTSQVKVEAIAPEEFVIEPQAKSLSMTDINFCAHRMRKTITELRQMGYDEEVIANIGDHEDVERETDPEVLARHEDVGADRGFNADNYQDQVRSVMVYEAYMMLDVAGTGEAELHRVVKAGNALLDIEQVDRLPFVAFVPLPIPHAFFGSNFAEKVISTQNARSVLTRSILDHAVISNNPRYMVVKGALTNPRELIDSRVGGIVNTSRPDAISPLPQAPLNPFIFQTLKLLEEDLEDTTGISQLSKGMNKDAVSKQNSAAMIEQLATMSQQRQKIVARNFANNFIRKLWMETYRLIVENETEERIIEIAGNFVPIDPASLEDRRDVMVELKLGYGEQEREAQKLMAMHSLFSQDPMLQPLYTPQNRYKLMTKIMEQSGYLNAEEYLTPPDQLPPQQPDPAQMMQMQMAQKQLEIQERQTALAEARAQSDIQIAQLKAELDAMKAQADHSLKSDQMDLKEEQFAHKRRIDEGELDVLMKSSTDVRGIASPTG
jgi:hypothetical protein